ncbi:hypothetical protein EQV77_02990 [Halobacillus fulvus]|nr:hypothetical protein EQV77_02990 [Halobacillus fulvus]
MGVYWFRTNTGGAPQEITVRDSSFATKVADPFKMMEMNVDDFVVEPGYVMMDVHERIETSSCIITSVEAYIKRGCTLLLVQHLVTSLCWYREQYEQFLERIQSPGLEYMIIPVVPVHLLKPEVVRFFSRKGCPFLCVKVSNADDLFAVKWEWIVQAQGYKRIPFTMIVKDLENTSNNYAELWSKVCDQYGIIKLTDLQDDEILSFQNLKDSGIFPKQGGIISGGSADYNLFYTGRGRGVDDEPHFLYHDSVPDVTISKGRILQVNQIVSKDVKGTHRKVSFHKHFV